MTRTLESVLTGLFDKHIKDFTASEEILGMALLRARNERDAFLIEIERMAAALADARNTIEDQRLEIEELSAFTQLARDAVNELNDESADVVLARARAELAKLRPVVEAAREFEAVVSDHGWSTEQSGLTLSVEIAEADAHSLLCALLDAVRAADADGTDVIDVTPSVGSAIVMPFPPDYAHLHGVEVMRPDDYAGPCIVCGHAQSAHTDEAVNGRICHEGCHCGGYNWTLHKPEVQP